ncbi:MAG: hypothetical protein QOK42_1291 [Frankiaceae bacterium]|nr:hypothetical protein [Frankiaceae bacterium]
MPALLRRESLLRDGVSASTVARRIASGRWISLAKGIYVERDAWQAATDGQRHLARARALAWTHRAAIASWSAAVAWDLPIVGPAPDAVHLIRGHGRVRSGDPVVRVAPLRRTELRASEGWRITSPARTFADLAREATLAQAVVLGDAILRRRIATVHELAEAVTRQAAWPGQRAAATALTLVDPRADSPLESLGRLGLVDAGLSVKPQHRVRVSGSTYYIDLLVNGRLAVEGDGALKYGPDRPPQTLYDEKIRQERIELSGLPVLRYAWPEVWPTPEPLVRRVLARLAQLDAA